MTASRLTAAVLSALLLSTGIAHADSASARAKGLAIARAAEARDDGFGSSRSDAKMILRDRSGTASVRDFTARALQVRGDGDQTSIEFNTPLDVRGMTLLTHSHASRDDDQWLYLPAASRTRRITSGSRTGSFAGSEFSYEDLVGALVEKYSYVWLRDEPCPGATDRDCHVNEQHPRDPDSGYSHKIAWLDTDDYRVYQVEYYDRSGRHFKTLVSSNFKLYNSKYWRPMRSVMTNRVNGKSTEMKWLAYDFNARLTTEEMAPFSLGR